MLPRQVNVTVMLLSGVHETIKGNLTSTLATLKSVRILMKLNNEKLLYLTVSGGSRLINRPKLYNFIYIRYGYYIPP